MAERIRPVVDLLFACDDARYDLESERWVLTNPWYAVTLPPGAAFPFVAEEFWVYAQLADGLGQFDLAVEMRHLVNDGPPRVMGWSPVTRLPFRVGDRLDAIKTAFALRRVPFREPGVYEIRVLAEGDHPGRWEPLTGVTFQLRVLDRREVV